MRTRTAIFILTVLLTMAFCPVRISALTIAGEKELAKEFMEEVRSQMTIITDPVSLKLVREIGERISGQLPPQPFDFSFHIVDEDQFNAFAGPGANIFVNRGLISSLDKVDELAGILGHEIAHSSSRHVAQMIDKSKLVNIGTLAGMLAGVLVGAGGGSDVGQAMIMGSAATGLTAMLAYSRENEREADQKGVVYLQNAGFSPEGLLTGLEKIRASDWYGTENIPGYLKTHPGTKERIITIESWLSTHPEARTVQSGIDSHRFQMVKYRLAGMYGNEDYTERDIAARLEADPSNPALHYGMALVLARKNRMQDAVGHLKKALLVNMFDPYVLVELGHLYLMSGQPDKALDVLEGLEMHGEVGIPARYYQGESRLESGDLAGAERDLKIVLKEVPLPYPRAWYSLARVSGEQGKKGLSYFYLGRYYHDIGEDNNARIQLNRSLKLLDSDTVADEARELLKKIEKKKSS